MNCSVMLNEVKHLDAYSLRCFASLNMTLKDSDAPLREDMDTTTLIVVIAAVVVVVVVVVAASGRWPADSSD